MNNNSPNKNSVEVVIMAAGKGQRLRSELTGIPKPLQLFDNTPYLELLVQSLLPTCKVTVLAGHFYDQVKDCAVNASASVQRVSGVGTGSDLREFLDKGELQSNRLMIMNADTLVSFCYSKFVEKAGHNKVSMALVLKTNQNPEEVVIGSKNNELLSMAGAEKIDKCKVAETQTCGFSGVWLVDVDTAQKLSHSNQHQCSGVQSINEAFLKPALFNAEFDINCVVYERAIDFGTPVGLTQARIAWAQDANMRPS